jgi:Dihydrodipicolinate synthetase family
VLPNEFWSRVFTFVPTATKNDGEEIDEKRLLETIDYQIENGVDGICIFGSTGGNGSFTDEEMKRATALAAKHINGRVPLVAGTGARTTTACIALSKHAEHVGCDGVMVLPVSYWPLTPDEVFDHYERVSRAIKIPMCVYNNPWTTGVDMKPEFLARLTKLDNVNCIKESTGDLTRITAIRLLTKDQVHADCRMGIQQPASLHGRRKRVGPGLHEFRTRRRDAVFHRCGAEAGCSDRADDLGQAVSGLRFHLCEVSHSRRAHWSRYSGASGGSSPSPFAHAQCRRPLKAEIRIGPCRCTKRLTARACAGRSSALTCRHG